jgi:putative cell wall-binding protein
VDYNETGYSAPHITSTRHFGSERVATSLATSAAHFASGSSPYAIIATAGQYPDALAASALAGALDAPILLIDKSVTTELKAELTRLGTTSLYIVGGESVVSKALADELAKITQIAELTRLGGVDRAATACLIAEEATKRYQQENAGALPPVAYLATGANFADALAASSVPATVGVPILLSGKDSLNANVTEFLDTYAITTILICGGDAVISDAVKETLENRGIEVKRLFGETRYDTADEIVKDAVVRFNITPKVLLIASGDNFPDALGGGASAARAGGLLLLTPKSSLHPKTAALISHYVTEETLSSVDLLGGTAALTEDLHDAVRDVIVRS